MQRKNLISIERNEEGWIMMDEWRRRRVEEVEVTRYLHVPVVHVPRRIGHDDTLLHQNPQTLNRYTRLWLLRLVLCVVDREGCEGQRGWA